MTRSGFDTAAGDVEAGDRGQVPAGTNSDFLVSIEDTQVCVLDDHGDELSAVARAELDALAGDHGHMTNVTVRANRTKNVTLDAAGLELIRRIAEQLKLPEAESPDIKPGDVYQEVLDSIESRLKRRMEQSDSPVYQSLAARIEKLRQQAITSVEESLAFLEQALQIAQDVVAADRAAEEGRLEELEPLVDPMRGALTQIVEENTPPGLHKIVPDIVGRIDAIVREVAYSGWIESDAGDKKVRKELRATLKNFGLPVTGQLFDKTYEYVRENY